MSEQPDTVPDPTPDTDTDRLEVLEDDQDVPPRPEEVVADAGNPA